MLQAADKIARRALLHPSDRPFCDREGPIQSSLDYSKYLNEQRAPIVEERILPLNQRLEFACGQRVIQSIENACVVSFPTIKLHRNSTTEISFHFLRR